MDVDVGSSAIASNIISVLRCYACYSFRSRAYVNSGCLFFYRSFAKHVKAQYGITIQGEEPDELPERYLLCNSVFLIFTYVIVIS